MEKNVEFIGKVTRYVNHAKQLAKCENYKQNVQFQLALQRCIFIARQITKPNFNLSSLLFEVRQNEKYFKLILPHPANKSYESSEEKLIEILKFN